MRIAPCMFCAESLGKINATDVELFLNGSVHEFYRLKVLITRKRVNTFMVGKKKNATVARKDKTLPRFQNTSQDPKTCPIIQNTSQNLKTLPRIQKYFPESKTLLRIQNTSQNPDFGMCFGFWDVFLESGKCFVLMSHHRMLMTKAIWSGVISIRFISTMIDAIDAPCSSRFCSLEMM